jgi:uncharacterized protein (TIGR00369 family)
MSEGKNFAFDPAPNGWTVVRDGGFIELVGPIWQKVEDGMIALAFTVEHKHHNRRGVLQGGMIATLLDRTIGTNVFEANGRKPQATLQLDIHYLKEIKMGSVVEARARIERRTRAVTFASATATVDGEPVAIARGVWKLLGET